MGPPLCRDTPISRTALRLIVVVFPFWASNTSYIIVNNDGTVDEELLCIDKYRVIMYVHEECPNKLP